VTGEGAATRVAFLPSLGRGPDDFAALAAAVVEAGFEAVPVTFTPDGVATLHDLAAQAARAPGNDATVWRDGWDGALAWVQSEAVHATPVDDWWTAGATAPVLVVQGLDDRVAPPGNGRDLVEQIGARARLVELPNAGHALLPEQPEAIATAVLQFLLSQG
jgi:pimeloyl-ACP methyl ester carboxylesterase